MTGSGLPLEDLTYSTIGAFFEVYSTLGFGYSERLYMKALEIELRLRGHKVQREVVFDVFYKGYRLGRHRLDMLVEDKLVVEGKVGVDLPKGSKGQVYSYLRTTKLPVGLLFHFGPESNFYRLDFRPVPEDPPVGSPDTGHDQSQNDH